MKGLLALVLLLGLSSVARAHDVALRPPPVPAAVANPASARAHPGLTSFLDQFSDFKAPISSQHASDAASLENDPGNYAAIAAPPGHPRTAAISPARHYGRPAGPGRTAPFLDAVGTEATALSAPVATTSNVVRIVLILSLMAFLPAMIICMTSFVRIAIVLSMIRHAFGMPETPPNQVLVALALFMTAFTMAPTLAAVNSRALQPFLAGHLEVAQAAAAAATPARAFMLRQVRDQDIKAVYDMSRAPLPTRAEDVDLMRLVPAFMLNELRVAFRIGFVVLLPFLLIDLVVSTVLLALGMMMVPPSTLSLPVKVLMFVLIDGWSLVMRGVVGSIH